MTKMTIDQVRRAAPTFFSNGESSFHNSTFESQTYDGGEATLFVYSDRPTFDHWEHGRVWMISALRHETQRTVFVRTASDAGHDIHLRQVFRSKDDAHAAARVMAETMLLGKAFWSPMDNEYRPDASE